MQPVQQQWTDPQADLLRSKVSSLTSKLEQYELQISQYERTFTQYESQISTLQQTNWRLEEKVSRQPVNAPVQPATIVVNNESWLVEEGKLNFRILILL